MVLSEETAEKRLAELRRQREVIDRAITDLTLYLELGRRLTTDCIGLPETEPTPPEKPAVARREPTDRPAEPRSEENASPRRPSSPVASEAVLDAAATEGSVAEGAMARRYGRTLIETALTVLEEAGRPLHAGEILAALEARGLSMPGQQDPVAALNTRLWKRSGPGGPVRRLGDAVYALPESPDR